MEVLILGVILLVHGFCFFTYRVYRVNQQHTEPHLMVYHMGWSCPVHAHAQSLSLSARNLFGRAEQLRVVSATTLPHWGQTLQLQFSKPYYKDIEKK